MEIRKGAVARKRCTAPFLYKKLQLNFISIHTPARGVTLQERVKHRQHIYISIHTPTRGVTDIKAKYYARFFDFNPHSHTGSDKRRKKQRRNRHISIHTPTRGVTFVFIFPVSPVGISIHTPTRGVTFPFFFRHI